MSILSSCTDLVFVSFFLFLMAPQRSMPLCMKQLHSALNREHKLKHWGRLQYGLFLKGAGLNVDDAMAFWQVT